MEVAHYLPMKASRINFILLSISLVTLIYMLPLRPSVGVPSGQALEESALSAEPIPPEEMPRLIEAPVAIEEPKIPIQSLEERGDALLFESEALFGTPFDQAVVMPFDQFFP